MKFDKRVVNYINDTIHVVDVLERERGDNIPPCDHSVSCISHSDKNPSLRVYAEPGRHSFCFTCGKTYTPYSMLRILTGFDFSDLVSYLQENYGLTIPGDLGSDESDTRDNKEIAMRIRCIKKYMNVRLLNLLQRALYVDSKNGGFANVEKLYDRVIALKESNQI